MLLSAISAGDSVILAETFLGNLFGKGENSQITLMTWLFHDGEKVFNLNYHTKSRQVELVKPRFDRTQWAYYPQSTDT